MMRMIRNIFVIQTILCAFSILIYEVLIWRVSTYRDTPQQQHSVQSHSSSFHSSVSCRGNNHTDRICFFKNLCYHPPINRFIFFHSLETVVDGVPKDRFSPALTDFSSVHDHNTQYFNYVDLSIANSSQFDLKLINGVSLIFKRFNPENLMHVFHDDLIPAFGTLHEVQGLIREDVQLVFADGRTPGPYSNLYENFLFKKPLYLNSSLTETLCFETAIIGLNKNSLWYQYGFTKPQGPLDKDLSTVYPLIMNFRRYFFNRFAINQNISEKESALLLTRENNRRILNVQDVVGLIQKRLNLSTTIMNLENFSVRDIIHKMLNAKIIVGIHGSLLILSLFLAPQSSVIELFPYGVSPNISTPYRTLVRIPGLQLNYHSWENKIETNSYPHPEYPPELGGISHLTTEEQEIIKKSHVKPFLCCYNAEWLYRIYQDTLVDLVSLSDTLDKALELNQQNYPSLNIAQRIYPSEVQNISCTVSYLNTIHVTWNPPWNALFMNNTMLEYELWYQNGDEEVKAYIMKKNQFIFREKILKNVHIWIRCHMNNRTGPFNTDPLICQ